MRYEKKVRKSDLYANVRDLPVNAIQRTLAVDTLRQAEKVSNAILWVLAAGRRLCARAEARTGGLLHNH